MSADELLATITPRPDAGGCEADGCSKTEGLASVDPHAVVADTRTLCGDCRLDYFEVLRS